MGIPLKSFAAALSAWLALSSGATHAATTTFFNGSQSYSLDTSGATWNTLTSEGYRFTYTMDKLWAGGYPGSPPGRFSAVDWPNGLHAQAVTSGANVGPAQVTIQRVDGSVFDLSALTFKLLGSTWATNASMEITPIRDGNDGPQVFLDATGSATRYGSTVFSYNGQSTSPLTGYDTYTLSLFVDFALTGTTLVDASVAPANPLPVPEPESYAMLLSGIGLIGLMAHRRRRRYPQPTA